MKSLKNVNTEKVAFKLASLMNDNDSLNKYHIKSVVSAYMAYEMQKGKEHSDIGEFLASLDCKDEVKGIIDKYAAGCFGIAKEIVNLFTDDELLAFILWNNSFDEVRNGDCSTPNGVMKLANRILDIKGTDNVLELCSGKGNYLVELVDEGSEANYVGVELNYTVHGIAILRASLIKENYQYYLKDALDFECDKKFNKAFSNYPFMVRTSAMNNYKQKIQEIFGMPKDSIQKASSDWLYNATLIENLENEGKAVALMTNGSSWNNTDKNIRKFFVENGYVEAVIALPAKLFESLSIPTTMIVLSKGNETVKLVDAKNLFASERKVNVLTDENIEQIINALSNESDISSIKSIEELEANEWILNASRYLEIVPEIKNGVEFGSVIKNITRGSQLKASELDEMKSSEPTDYQYLLISNINDGIISLDVDEQYLKEIPKKLEKYCIKNNSIVLSKIGMPLFKSAVANVDANKKLVANGNLFVIELEEEKVNPYYIQAFFTSDVGVAMFKSIHSGASIATISIENLKKMTIPLPSMEVQNSIANKYKAAIDEIVLLKRKLDRVVTRMKHIYDEGE